jgi:hypothetical protein
MPDKSLAQRAVENATLKLIGIILGTLGSAVVAWYTAHSARLHALPFYQIAPIVGAVLLLCALIVYVFVVTLGRIQRQMAEAGGCADVWLHEAAREDRLQLNHRVLVETYNWGNAGVFLNNAEEEPFMVVGFNIFNASVYEVSIDPKIDGHMSYGLRPLRGKLEMSLAPYKVPRNLKHGWRSHFMLRQSLTKEDAEYIKAHQNQPLRFDNLIVRVAGGDDFSMLPQMPLDFSTAKSA